MADTTRRDFLKTAALATAALAPAEASAADPVTEPLSIPDWVYGVTRMGFLSPGQVDQAAKAGVQVVHTNLDLAVLPAAQDGGGLSKDDDAKLRELVTSVTPGHETVARAAAVPAGRSGAEAPRLARPPGRLGRGRAGSASRRRTTWAAGSAATSGPGAIT